MTRTTSRAVVHAALAALLLLGLAGCRENSEEAPGPVGNQLSISTAVRV